MGHWVKQKYERKLLALNAIWKKFYVLQKKVLSVGPNRTVEVLPNSSAEPNVRSITKLYCQSNNLWRFHKILWHLWICIWTLIFTYFLLLICTLFGPAIFRVRYVANFKHFGGLYNKTSLYNLNSFCIPMKVNKPGIVIAS